MWCCLSSRVYLNRPYSELKRTFITLLAMGRNRRFRQRPNKQGQSTDAASAGEQADRRGNYKLTEKKNALFEEYYKNQSFLSEEELEPFLETLRAPLPATFRVTGSNAHARELLKFIKGEYFSQITDGAVEGKTIEPPKCLPWYPEEMAWQIPLDRMFIRHHPALAKLHEFLVSETESGYISRQEAVSMIPPLLLDIQPHHTVFDMCAAPGSKTAQLIEILHSQQEVTNKLPTGLVLANDSDNKRCYLMMHQVKRLASPNFLITNHDASNLPNFLLSEEDPKKILKFDRILADVPCSGDGTMRKNPDVWSKWHTAMAHNLHSIQKRILERAVQLLATGGRLVYSTCSMNPVEDEAVLSTILQKCEGAVEILDVSDSLPGLKYSPGISSWKLLSRDGQWFASMEEVPEKYQTQMRPTMFPPSPEEAKKLNLNRCLRILPHLQNTGGFFVAVLQKVREVPWVKEKAAKTEAPAEQGNGEDAAATAAGDGDEAHSGDKRKAFHDDGRAPPKKKVFHGYKEDPFVFLTEEEPVLPAIMDFFGISSDFPKEQLLVRSHEGKKRNLYFASKEVKNILDCNQGRIKFINGGLKVLSRSDSQYVECDFRLVQDGMNVMSQYLGKRRICIDAKDLAVLMSQENPYLTKMSESVQTQIEDLGQGGMYFVYEPDSSAGGPQCKLSLAGWRGRSSCRLFLPRWDRFHFMRMLGIQPPTKKARASKENSAADGNGDASPADGGSAGEGEEEMASDEAPPAAEEEPSDDASSNVTSQDKDSIAPVDKPSECGAEPEAEETVKSSSVISKSPAECDTSAEDKTSDVTTDTSEKTG